MEKGIIETVVLRVRDLERSSAFYEGVLGLNSRNAGDYTREFFISPEKSPLLSVVEVPDANPKPARGLGLYHFALLVPDRGALAAVLRRLADLGLPLQGASDHHVSEALYLADPDGHGVEIYRDRPEQEWAYTEDGEIYMTTDSLNLQELVTLAERGAGLPDGTIIGHIHLHISDLKKAEAFYVDVLGFDAMVRSYPGALFVSTNDYHHHIGLNTWAGPDALPPDDQTIGMIEFTARAPRPPAVVDRGNGVGEILDPDGIRIRLVT